MMCTDKSRRSSRPNVSCRFVTLLAGLACLAGALSSPLPAASPQAVPDGPQAADSLRPEASAPSVGATDTASGWDVPLRVPYQERNVPVSAKILRYAQRLVEQYDTNHDGQLDKQEWQKMHGNPAIVDRDHDGLITVDDLARYITIYGRYRHIQLIAPALVNNSPQQSAEGGQSPGSENPRNDVGQPPSAAAPDGGRSAAEESAPAQAAAEMPSAAPAAPAAEAAATAAAALGTTTGSQPLTPAPPPLPAVTRRAAAGQRFFVPLARVPQGVPPWFIARDRDGDGQLTLSEFAPHATQADIEEFSRYDTNHDGVITIDEVLQSGKPATKAVPSAKLGTSATELAPGATELAPGVRAPGPAVRGPGLGVRGQGLGVRGQGLGVRDQGTGN